MSNEGNIWASILLRLLKYIVVGCSTGNQIFTGMLISNYGPLNMLFHFFLINHLKCFSRDFCQKVYEETILFQLKFQKSIPTCSILKKIRMFNFVILKWWPFKYKVKNWKMCSFLGLFFSQVKNADNLNFSWIKYFGNDFPFLIKYHVRVYYCWTSFWCFQCYFWNQ